MLGDIAEEGLFTEATQEGQGRYEENNLRASGAGFNKSSAKAMNSANQTANNQRAFSTTQAQFLFQNNQDYTSSYHHPEFALTHQILNSFDPNSKMGLGQTGRKRVNLTQMIRYKYQQHAEKKKGGGHNSSQEQLKHKKTSRLSQDYLFQVTSRDAKFQSFYPDPNEQKPIVGQYNPKVNAFSPCFKIASLTKDVSPLNHENTLSAIKCSKFPKKLQTMHNEYNLKTALNRSSIDGETFLHDSHSPTTTVHSGYGSPKKHLNHLHHEVSFHSPPSSKTKKEKVTGGESPMSKPLH